MVDNLRQEAMHTIDNAKTARDRIKEAIDALDEMKSSNAAFYRFMKDRSELVQQTWRLEDASEDLLQLIDRHIEDLESCIE